MLEGRKRRSEKQGMEEGWGVRGVREGEGG